MNKGRLERWYDEALQELRKELKSTPSAKSDKAGSGEV